ncbi:Sodium/glucose cotransporter [Polystyrenella longa]|uniref:Sodium/glucose cotransporter n=1 Tax=Polystyrenella longa TaxID=2528007 RepID=A0A518CU07_9PLAN|nr:sodium/solute symporter [Polystyrenella longa]QDU82713.1 Sodium/glucose cotransporter [Polystyrenella longa]
MEWPFSTLDVVIFLVTLVGVMVVGLIAGRKEDTSEDYFLAGRQIRWWGVAGSIFGSNVSANHMVGMMGIGFTVGFAQAHFELGAILGLMVLCYFFLPVYRKLNIYTLSEYLEKRYDHRSRLAYAIIMLILMVLVEMVPALYIGSRSACVLLGETGTTVTVRDVDSEVTNFDPVTGEPVVGIATESKTFVEVVPSYYVAFVIAFALITASYTIFGGLKAVVYTDALQSLLILISGLTLAALTFSQLGGWDEMMTLDTVGDLAKGIAPAEKMHLYLPSNHEALPWTGVFTGLICMHCYYWGTNQFIVQRALGARNDIEARTGIVAAGFLKLLIPFFAIGTGIAAYYLFQIKQPDEHVVSDIAFTKLMDLVVPAGYGLFGLIAAGLIGAILSSIDSMMNSSATIVSVDIYKRYIKPDATDKEMILVGRVFIACAVLVATLMAIFVLNPNSERHFFLDIVDYQGYLTPGILVAFFFGMFWKRGTATAAFVTVLGGIAFSAIIDKGATWWLADVLDPQTNHASAEWVRANIGESLHFFHRVILVLICSSFLYVIVSLLQPAPTKEDLPTWQSTQNVSPLGSGLLVLGIAVALAVYISLGYLLVYELLSPLVAGLLGAAWTLIARAPSTVKSIGRRLAETDQKLVGVILTEDRVWSTLLCMLAIFMLYYYV